MKIIAAAFGAASLLALASSGSNAQEIQAQPLGLATANVEVTTVAFGCGPGFFPNRFGVCRPRFVGGYGYGRPYGYGYGYGRGYYGGGYGYRRFGYY